MNGSTRSNFISLSLVAVAALAQLLLPPLLLGAAWTAVVLGMTAWVAGYALKVVLAGLVFLAIPESRSRYYATISGFVSSGSELGVAALLFVKFGEPFTRLDMIVYAASAGATEAIVLLLAAFTQDVPEDTAAAWTRSANCSACVRYMILIERIVAMAGHAGSRALVCVGLATRNPALFVLAVTSFAITDGLAMYGTTKNWNWFDPLTCRRYYGTCAAISAIEIAVVMATI